MSNKLNLFQKLLEIQKHVIGLGKDSKGYDYKFVSGSKVLGEIKPLMNKHGILLKQEVLSITNERQDYSTSKGSKSEILSSVAMRFTWVDAETGEKDENLFGANGQNAWDKGVGSALTYAERYFLLKYFHIATDEDDIDNPARKEDDRDSQPAKKVEAPKPTSKPLLEKGSEQWKSAINFLLKGEVTIEQVKQKYTLLEPNEVELRELVNQKQ